MKNYVTTFKILALFAPSLAFAQVGGVGGGDQCKNEIEKHRAAIEGWIQRDEAKDLDFTKALIKGQTYESYKQRMQKFLEKGKVVVTCHLDPSRITDPTAQKIAQEQKVSYRTIAINGQPTTCINFENKKGISRIACNYDLIMNPNALGNPNFKNTHHEFASIAGVELRASNPSDFSVSDQLSEFEVWKLVKALGPKSNNSTAESFTVIPGTYFDRTSACYYNLSQSEDKKIITISVFDLQLNDGSTCYIDGRTFKFEMKEANRYYDMNNTGYFSTGIRVISPTHLKTWDSPELRDFLLNGPNRRVQPNPYE